MAVQLVQNCKEGLVVIHVSRQISTKLHASQIGSKVAWHILKWRAFYWRSGSEQTTNVGVSVLQVPNWNKGVIYFSHQTFTKLHAHHSRGKQDINLYFTQPQRNDIILFDEHFKTGFKDDVTSAPLAATNNCDPVCKIQIRSSQSLKMKKIGNACLSL